MEEDSLDYLEEAKKRIIKLKDKVFLMIVAPNRIIELAKEIFHQLDNLTKDITHFFLFVDMSELKYKGDVNYRRFIRSNLLERRNKLAALVFILNRNIFLRTFISFLLGMNMPIPAYLVASIDDAWNLMSEKFNDYEFPNHNIERQNNLEIYKK
ncbi:MAG: hypothetical protein OEZ01_15095 [Candidatus Heimdallarchaeota archaeon]|nr:hypothetical protein [Candidatus Heimdallarchaeota archaeon]MDH5647334.1 hypothetical protein [Candidatus Heimdallarchaeota archaeon]